MRTHLKRHLSQMSEGADEGFTLIELLVVLLILGILLAIAIPTFLTVTKSASSTAAASNLQTALTGVDTFYTQNGGSYSGLTTSTTVSTISQEGTGLTYVTGTASSTAAGSISLYIPGSNSSDIALAAFSPGNSRCYVIVDQKDSSNLDLVTETGFTGIGTSYGYVTGSSTTTCKASTAAAAATNFKNTGGFPA